LAEPELDHRTARFAVHTDDLEDILSKAAIERVHLIGWCTGADVCLEFLSRHQERVLSLTCLNGGFVNICGVRTPFQTDLEQVVRRVSGDATCAKLYHTLLTNPATAHTQTGIRDTSVSIRTTMSGVDDDLAHLTGAPLQSAELLQRYCLLLEHYFDEAPSAVPACNVPAFFGTAKDDEIAPFEASVQVAMNFAQSQVHFSARGGHFAPCREDSLVREITQFLVSHPACRDPSVAEVPRVYP
jgi:pimeloyl-ACP methyl ester carboxylesterase